MLRCATLVLVAAAVLAPLAAAGRYNPPPQRPPQHAVVRTELVPESDGFDWLDAAAGFGLAVISVGLVLLVLGADRPNVRHGRN